MGWRLRWWPWAGWIGGLLGWVLSHQLGSDLVQFDCRLADPPVMLLIGLAGGAVAAIGGLLSWRHWRRSDRGAAGLIAATAALAAGIFLLAILFQTASSLIIPQCHA